MLTMVGSTDVGQRSHNEDCFLAEHELCLAVVADGVGGHASGEVASRIVADTLASELAAGNTLSSAILMAHQEVKNAAAAGKGRVGMGAAVVAAVFADYDYEICWVGDCRAYLWDGELIQLTRDHSHVESLLSSGLISWEEAQVRTDRNLITQAVGGTDASELDVGRACGSLTRGEELLLCSDGLNDVLSGQWLAEILSNGANTRDRCEQLVRAAAVAGGKDNITALLITPDSKVPLGPVSRPAAVSISRLDGGVDYYVAPGKQWTDPHAVDNAPTVGGIVKTRSHLPVVVPPIDYLHLDLGAPPRMRLDRAFFRSVLEGLTVGAVVVVLVFSAKWLWQFIISSG